MTTMRVSQLISSEQEPTFLIETVNATTRAESGPQWVRKLLDSIQSSTVSTSSNLVSVLREEGRTSFMSDLTLTVEMQIPGCALEAN